jgi:hypothetical protein
MTALSNNISFNIGNIISLKDISAVKNDKEPEKYKILYELAGSTGPVKVERISDKKEFVLKTSTFRHNNAYTHTRNAHEANEYLAFKLYEAAGCRIPDTVKLVEIIGTDKIGVLESFIDGATLGELLDSRLNTYTSENAYKAETETFPVVQKDLLIHALLGNWDININQNIMIAKNKSGDFEFNKPVVIDCGGTLFFRAQGAPKNTSNFSNEVKNIRTLIRSAQRPYSRPLKNLIDKDPEDLKRMICADWNVEEKKEAILTALDSVADIVGPYYEKMGISHLSISNLRSILEGRLEYIKDYCKSVSGGNYRKTRKHKRHSKKTRRHRR